MLLELALVAAVVALTWLFAPQAAEQAVQMAMERGPGLRGVSEVSGMVHGALVDWTVGVAALLLAAALGRWRRPESVAVPLLVPATAALTGLGLVLQLGYGDPLHIERWTAPGFGTGVMLGGLAALTVSLMVRRFAAPESLTWRSRLGLAAFAASLVLALLVFGDDPVGGQRINLTLAGKTFQPLELVKLSFTLLAALELAARAPRLQRQRVRIAGFVVPQPRLLLGSLLSLAGLMFAVYVVQDYGMALIAGLLFLGLFHTAMASRPWFALAVLVVLALLGLCLAFPELGGSFLGDRLRMWTDPWGNGLRLGTQLGQSYWAFDLGGLRGQGLGASPIGGLAEGHTDMILAHLARELGLLGGLLYVGLFGTVVLQGLRIGDRARSPRRAFLAVACSLLLLAQFLVIFGGTVGWFPLTGVVVPFLSRGMSSMVVFLVIVGLLLALASDGRARAETLQMELSARSSRELALASLVLLAAASLRLTQLGLMRDSLSECVVAELRTTAEESDLAGLQCADVVDELAERAMRGELTDRAGLALRGTQADGSPTFHDGFGLGSLAGPVDDRGGRVYREPWMLERLYDEQLRGYGWREDWRLWFAERCDGERCIEDFLFVAKHAEERDEDRERALEEAQGAAVHSRPIARPDLAELAELARLRPAAREEALVAWNERVSERAVATSLDRELTASIRRMLPGQLEEARSRSWGQAPAAAVWVTEADTGRPVAVAQWPDLELAESTWRSSLVSDREFKGLYGPWKDKTGKAAGMRQLGSPGKLITALALVRAGLAGLEIDCASYAGRRGYKREGWSMPVRNHGNGGPLRNGLEDALEGSRNCYFAGAADRLGPEAFTSLVEDGLDIGFDAASWDPGPAGSRELGLTGIGQGSAAMTVRQLAWLGGAIASGGTYRACDGVTLDTPCTESVLTQDEEGIEAILRGMLAVMEGPSGTGRWLTRHRSVPGVRIYAKTGTADDPVQEGELPYGLEEGSARPHSWFVALVEPDTEPAAQAETQGRLVVSVVVFRGGYGSQSAGAIAMETIRELAAAGRI